MGRRGKHRLIAAALSVGLAAGPARAQPQPEVNTIRDVFAHLRTCWKPPPAEKAEPMDITVIVSFNRAGNILGRARITYESAGASDNDRLAYRVAVMEALQRCTPMPFTAGIANAIAGRPFAVKFQNRKSSPKPTERRA